MPKVTVRQPPQNGSVAALQPFLVSGRASGDVEVESHPIDSVTVQVDDGPVVEAVTTFIAGSVPPAVLFKAFAEVDHGADPHVVRVVATNDTAQKAHATVDVFTGPIFRTSPAAILLEVSLPRAVDPGDPKLHAMVGRVQHGLLPLSRALGSIGKVLVGPNLVAITGPSGPGLRFGLWIEDGDFPVMAAQPPDFPLPRLLPAAEGPCFDATPGLSVPPPRGFSPGFALGIPVETLQRLLDAVAPGVKAAAAQQDVRLDSLIASVMAPGSVTTSFSGEGHLLGIGVPFTVSATEVIGLTAATDGGAAVPAVLGTSHSSSVGSVLEWLVGLVIPVFDIALLAAWGKASSVAGEISNQVNGVMAPLLAGIPTRFPFRNTDLPIPSPPDFPALEPTWLSFGITGSTVVGTGTADVVARSQAVRRPVGHGGGHDHRVSGRPRGRGRAGLPVPAHRPRPGRRGLHVVGHRNGHRCLARSTTPPSRRPAASTSTSRCRCTSRRGRTRSSSPSAPRRPAAPTRRRPCTPPRPAR